MCICACIHYISIYTHIYSLWEHIINNNSQLKWKISIAFNRQRYKHLNIHFVMWLTKSLQSWPSSSADCVTSSVQKWDGIGDWHKERKLSQVNNDEVSKMKSKVTAEKFNILIFRWPRNERRQRRTVKFSCFACYTFFFFSNKHSHKLRDFISFW